LIYLITNLNLTFIQSFSKFNPTSTTQKSKQKALFPSKEKNNVIHNNFNQTSFQNNLSKIALEKELKQLFNNKIDKNMSFGKKSDNKHSIHANHINNNVNNHTNQTNHINNHVNNDVNNFNHNHISAHIANTALYAHNHQNINQNNNEGSHSNSKPYTIHNPQINNININQHDNSHSTNHNHIPHNHIPHNHITNNHIPNNHIPPSSANLENNSNSRNKLNNIDSSDKQFMNSVLNKSTIKKNQNQSFENKSFNNIGNPLNHISQEMFGNELNKNKSRNENRNYLVKNHSNSNNTDKVNLHLTGSYQKNLLLTTQLMVKNVKNESKSTFQKKKLMENTIKIQLIKKSEILLKKNEIEHNFDSHKSNHKGKINLFNTIIN